MTIRKDLQLPLNHVGIDVLAFSLERQMIHKTGTFPTTRLDTSILSPDRLKKTSISCPDNQSISSEETISDSEIEDVDRRELLAAKQLRRLQFSKDCVPSKRQRTIAQEAIPLPVPLPLETHSNTHLIASIVNSKLDQPLPLTSLGNSLEASAGLQSPSWDLSDVLDLESRKKLKELHETKFPDLMKSLDEMSEQLVQSQHAMQPLWSFITESNECLAEMRIKKYQPCNQLRQNSTRSSSL